MQAADIANLAGSMQIADRDTAQILARQAVEAIDGFCMFPGG